jgi:hypothetical protein
MKIQIRVTQGKNVYQGEMELTDSPSPKSRAREFGSGVHKSKHHTPAGAVDSLYEERFFASERILAAVTDRLRQKGYHFGSPSVVMALKSRAYLQRRGSKGSYRFVQKFPPAS